MRRFKNLICIYLISGVLGTIVFVSLFWTEIFKLETVLFFRSIYLLLLACSLTVTVLLLLRRLKWFDVLTIRDVIIIALLLFFGNNWIFGSIPFNVSRSNSMVLMRYLYDQPHEGQSEMEITNHIRKVYFDEYGAVKIRIAEQVDLGNIKKVNQEYYITKKGAKLVDNMGYAASLYNIKNNFLLPKAD